jgi:hypothetical protein
MLSRSIERFLNAEGQVNQWPTKHADKQLVLAYLAAKFSSGISYDEKGVNDLLKQWHTFNDWLLLRRELYEYGYLDRVPDGSKYWPTGKLKESGE